MEGGADRSRVQRSHNLSPLPTAWLVEVPFPTFMTRHHRNSRKARASPDPSLLAQPHSSPESPL